LYGRDAVALSNIEEDIEGLSKWAKDKSTFENEGESEGRMFWLISALIEIGCLDIARDLGKQFHPAETRYLLALYLGSRFSQEVRAITSNQKKEAEKLSQAMESRVSPLLGKLIAEFRSHLLEYRKGEITPIHLSEKD
jgi:hypothetical protein